eukprot:804325-Rhodomonas_salina.2
MDVTPDWLWEGRVEPRPVQITGNRQQIARARLLVADRVNLTAEELAASTAFKSKGPGNVPVTLSVAEDGKEQQTVTRASDPGPGVGRPPGVFVRQGSVGKEIAR